MTDTTHTDPAPALDLAALRRVAEGATQGPWHTPAVSGISAYVRPEKGHAICGIPVPFHDWGNPDCQVRRDAAFIAAWSPATALALLDELERARAVIEAAKEFRAHGTVLTACNRGACQQVVEHADNSDPQAKLYAALKAYERKEPHDEA